MFDRRYIGPVPQLATVVLAWVILLSPFYSSAYNYVFLFLLLSLSTRRNVLF